MVHPDVQKLADAAQAFCRSWLHNETPQMVVVSGTTGTGKTRVGKKILKWSRAAAETAYENRSKQRLAASVPSILWVDWLLFSSPENCSDWDWARMIRDIDDASLVVVDDVGTETDQFKTGVPIRRLCQLLNRCERKWTWITTNLLTDAWQSKWDARVEDRLLSGKVIEINAPSFRSEV